ncbi:MAG: hypothetical protein CMM78_09240 [Rhodospirillaceae bacterium]|nr:hypothetical protein [Rhodospirillales bacterium]MAX48379.1 hypothetical protein [Rhodospirillaceae bacterium]
MLQISLAPPIDFALRVLPVTLNDGMGWTLISQSHPSPSCGLDNSGGNGPFRAGNLWAVSV